MTELTKRVHTSWIGQVIFAVWHSKISRASGRSRRQAPAWNSRVTSFCSSFPFLSSSSSSSPRRTSCTATRSASSGTAAVAATAASAFRHQPNVRRLRWGYSLHAAFPRPTRRLLLPDAQHDRGATRSCRAGRFRATTRGLLRRSKRIRSPGRSHSIILAETAIQYSELFHQKWRQEEKAAATAAAGFTFTSRGRYSYAISSPFRSGPYRKYSARFHQHRFPTFQIIVWLVIFQ